MLALGSGKRIIPLIAWEARHLRLLFFAIASPILGVRLSQPWSPSDPNSEPLIFLGCASDPQARFLMGFPLIHTLVYLAEW